MKTKYLGLIAILGLFLCTGCEKNPIGGTATEEMAGEWYVTVQGIGLLSLKFMI